MPAATAAHFTLDGLETLPNGQVLVLGTVRGLVEEADAQSWMDAYLALPAHQRRCVLVDASQGLDVSHEARQYFLRSAAQERAHSRAVAVVCSSVLFRLSLACLAVLNRNTAIRAFSSSAAARAWLIRSMGAPDAAAPAATVES